MTDSIGSAGAGGAGALTPAGSASAVTGGGGAVTNLADVLERVLDKGVVIVGDIRVNLLDIELLTIKLRLLVASVDTARRIGIDWWQHDPWVTGREGEDDGRSLAARVNRLERELAPDRELPRESEGEEDEAGLAPDARRRKRRGSGARE
jgi:gas vesicle protein GvpA/GvpJ/GvpM family